MIIHKSHISGVLMIDSLPFRDHRGSFFRMFCEDEMKAFLGPRRIVQINFSHTSIAGALRGMHFQYPPHAEMKMIRCLSGRVFDVVVDLRQKSATFLHWHGETLTPENHRMMVIPEGCAHGFQALKENCELLYLHTAFYRKEAEGGVRFDDPAIGITWPKVVADTSEKDSSHPLLSTDFHGIAL